MRAEIRRQVYERAGGCCEYCYSCEDNTGQPLHIDHIIPDGGHTLDNLCLACVNCNLSKAAATVANDPETGEAVALFNPRTDAWADHFEWIEYGALVQGLTAQGRATIERLKMNRPRLVRARLRWIEGGNHPP